MAEIMRHVGKTTNTDRRLVVVYMQIPGREDHALVVDTDSLPTKYHDDLMQVVQGEAQKEPVLANILSRRIMPSTGVDMMSSLHHANQLQAVPISNIVMLPAPNQGVPLSKLIEFMGKGPAAKAPDEHRENRIVENQNIDKDDAVYSIAKGLIFEADMLVGEANRKREQAYAMYPAMRPTERKTTFVDVEGLPTEAALANVAEAVDSAKAKRKTVAKKNS